MTESRMQMPSGFGGIMRYDAEYKSRFMLSPSAVIAFLVFLLVFAIALRVLFPITP